MQRYASMVRALNSEGIYIQNRNDAIRFNYGLMKGLQKLASGTQSLSNKEQEMLDNAKRDSKANLKKVLDKAKDKMDSYVEKSLSKYGAYGVFIEVRGAIHNGDISFKITNNYLNRRGDTLDLKEFKAFVAETSKLNKDYAKYLEKAVEEVEKLSNLSLVVYEGKGEVPKEPSRKTKMLISLVTHILDLGAHATQILMVLAILTGQPGVMAYLSIILGAGLFRWLMASVRKYGFKGTVNRVKLKARNLTKLAHDAPPLKKQAYLLSQFDVFIG
jgi:hypothetical protein